MQNINRVLLGAGIALFVLTGTAASADEDSLRFQLSTGIDYVSGDYGGDVDTEDTYIPITLAVDYGRLRYRLTVPFLSVSAPEGSIFAEPGGQTQPGSGETVTETGLGDIIASVTLFDVIYNPELGLALDITGKVKFATADEKRGLGTGEADYALQADIYRSFDRATLFGTVGYKYRGNPAGIDLDNTLYGSIGAMLRLSERSSGGLAFDYRQSSFPGEDDIREVTAFVSRSIHPDWRVQLHFLTGFGDSSPDFGTGVTIKRYFR